MFGAKRGSKAQPTHDDDLLTSKKEPVTEPISPANEPLLSEKRRSTPGAGFKVKIDGRWQDYAPSCNRLLMDAYEAGCPSMRLNVKGHMYKFDFEKLEQKCLNTLETHELRAPHNTDRPTRSSFFKKENFTSPLTKGRKSFSQSFVRRRPVLVVRVPEGGPGKFIHVPHPQKLGKTLGVGVPKDAQVGQPLFVPVPRKDLSKKVKYAVGGTVGGITTAVAVDAIGSGSLAGGTAAAGAGFAGIATGPAILGAVAIGSVALGVGYGVTKYAKRNPAKFVVMGALTLGSLALADHVAEVGVVEATGDVVEGVGDFVDGARDGVEDVIEGVEDATEFAEDVGEDVIDMSEWLGDTVGDGVDIIMDLF